VFDEERAIVSGRFNLYIARDTGQPEPPEAIIVSGVRSIHLHDLYIRKGRADGTDYSVNIVRVSHLNYSGLLKPVFTV